MLNRVLDTVLSSVVYDFLDTRTGKFLYGVGYSRTQSRLIECEEAGFRVQTPSAGASLREAHIQERCHEPVATHAFVTVLSKSKDDVTTSESNGRTRNRSGQRGTTGQRTAPGSGWSHPLSSLERRPSETADTISSVRSGGVRPSPAKAPCQANTPDECSVSKVTGRNGGQ